MSHFIYFQGSLNRLIRDDDTVWTLEDRKKICIVMTKADPINKEIIWTGLLKEEYLADALTLHEMRKKLDLEKFQIEVWLYELEIILFN